MFKVCSKLFEQKFELFPEKLFRRNFEESLNFFAYFVLTTFLKPLKVTMAGYNFQKLIVALCTPGIRRHKKRQPMSARYNFTVQITREKRLAHGDNAVADFLCCSGFQQERKHLIDSSPFKNANKALGQGTREVSLHFEHFKAPVP